MESFLFESLFDVQTFAVWESSFSETFIKAQAVSTLESYSPDAFKAQTVSTLESSFSETFETQTVSTLESSFSETFENPSNFGFGIVFFENY